MSVEVDEIIARWTLYLERKKEEKYEPGPANLDAPPYEPLPVNAGPRPITIEEYRNRQQKKPAAQTIVKKKKKRAGKQYQRRKELAILYRDLNLSTEKATQRIIRSEIRSFKDKHF